MPSLVNLDALIPREDFRVEVKGVGYPKKDRIQITDLEKDAFFFAALRKPDFQRETAEWDPKKVALLIRTFIEGDLIPGVILWQNRELLFVIDGSHRLSALIAWVQDDYGDREVSQKFFGYEASEEQKTVAERTRKAVEKAFGSYQMHKKALADPASYGPDIIDRARRFATISLILEWVNGDFVKAEDSFIRINQQAVMIQPNELELIRNRKKPNTIAARAILRRGAGHKYWSHFPTERQEEVIALSKEVHDLLFAPPIKYPIASLDLPLGGTPGAGPALRMVYDFVNLCVETPSAVDDTTGERTVEYLARCLRVLKLVSSDDRSSLGLHPAVYLYSWTGKQMPILLLVVTALVIELEQNRRLPQFTKVRSRLESYLIANKTVLNQVVRKFGAKSSGIRHVADYYRDVIAALGRDVPVDAIADELRKNDRWKYLQPEEMADVGTSARGFSTQVKAGSVMRDLLRTAPRCSECGGLLSSHRISVDHIDRREEGGTNAASNAQLTHGYCNSAYKENRVRESRARQP